jgi:DUF2917 family protein
METTQRTTLTELRRNATLRLRDGHDRTVAVFEGQIWVTQSGDSNDFIVSAGDSLTLRSHGITVIQALNHARIMVLEPAADQGFSTSYELQRLARANRAAVLGEMLGNGLHAARQALVQALSSRPSHATPIGTAWATRA